MDQKLKIKLAIGLLIIAGSLYFFSYAGVNELITPIRVDSLYVQAQKADYERQRTDERNRINPHFYYSPDNFGMCYNNLEAVSIDSLKLKGWYITSDDLTNSTTILIIHDLNESRITSLETAKQFNDRGYSVCLFDMRAHGVSEGEIATYGYMEKYDIRTIIDTLMKHDPSKNIAVLGIGAGADIALQAANIDIRIKVIIAQSPFNNLYNFVKIYADEKWGVLNGILFPRIKGHLEDELKFDLSSIDMTRLAKKITVPTLFIAGTSDKILKSQYTREVFQECVALKKQYWPVKNAKHSSIEETAAEAYYNRISVYIINNMPKKVKKTRFKKLV